MENGKAKEGVTEIGPTHAQERARWFNEMEKVARERDAALAERDEFKRRLEDSYAAPQNAGRRIGQQEERAEKAEAKLKEAQEVLERIEKKFTSCPSCDLGTGPKGHVKNCPLAALLPKEEEEKVPTCEEVLIKHEVLEELAKFLDTYDGGEVGPYITDAKSAAAFVRGYAMECRCGDKADELEGT